MREEATLGVEKSAQQEDGGREPTTPLNRQEFLAVAGMLLTGSAGSACASTKPRHGRAKRDTRVVVIGAGLAGLAAASAMQAEDLDVVVIEARDRIGGRIVTSNKWQDSPLDLGASWIHGVKGNPLTTIADQIKARRLITRYSNAVTFNTNGKQLSADQETRLDQLRAKLTQAIKRAQAKDDDHSIRQAMEPLTRDRALTPDDRKWLDFIISSEIEQEFSGSARRLSAHWYDQADEFAGDDALFADGFTVIPKNLAKGLDIKLGQIVREIKWHDSPIRVITQDSEFTADHVLVTLPLGVLQSAKVTFTPALPRAKKEAIAKLGMGVLNKCYLRFKEPFWPKDVDWLEYIPSRHGHWTEWVSFWRAVKQPVLLGFYAGDRGREIEELSDAEIVADGMQTLKTMFGTSIPEPIDVQITRWGKDPFSLGSYSFNAVGSNPAMRKTLAASLDDKLYFAGEAAHPAYFGTAHGAYLSGLRAAKEILAD